MRSLSLIAAGLLATLPGVVHAGEPPCLSPTEFSSLAGYALPSAISGTTKRCGPSLGASSFIASKGADLATRYATLKEASWPAARAAFIKLSAQKGDANMVLRTLPDAPLQGMLDAIFEGMVSQEIPLEKCGTIDTLLRLLSPLPPENTAELVALAVGLTSATKPGKLGQLSICKG